MSAFPPRYAAKAIARDGCSCGLYCSPETATDDNDGAAAEDAERALRRYGRKRWSEAKIARAMQQAQRCKPPRDEWRGLRPDIIERLGALCEAAGGLALVVHQYNGNIDSERFTLVRGPPCKCSELAMRATMLPEDQVLHVKPSPPAGR